MGLKRTAELLQRCPRTVRKTLGKSKTAGARVGRPPMSEQDNAKCDAALVALQKRAKAQREVTASMVKQNAGVPYCEATIRNAFRLHGKPFRRLWEKPVLKPEDVTKRLAFVTKCGARPRPAGRAAGQAAGRAAGRAAGQAVGRAAGRAASRNGWAGRLDRAGWGPDRPARMAGWAAEWPASRLASQPGSRPGERASRQAAPAIPALVNN